MRSKWFGLFGFMLALFLVAGPLAGDVMAASDSGGSASGHDMSTMNQSGQDMSNMDGMNSQDNSGSSGSHDSNSGGGGESAGDTINWPVIYGFGAFNLLVIIIAALLKNKSVISGVN